MTSDNFFPEVGGGQIHVLNLLENLMSTGNDVIFFTNQGGQSEYDTGKKVIRMPWQKKNIFKIFWSLWKLSKDRDIIHCHYCYRLAMLASIVGRLRGIPVVITLHGMGILDHPNAPRLFQFAHSVYRYVSLKLCNLVISTSQDLANVAYKYISESKIVIILNGYDSKVFNEQALLSDVLKQKYIGKKVIVTVRRLVPKNGIHYLVEAMTYIKEQVPEAIFLAIGPGRMTDHIKSRISDLKLEDSVVLLGEIPNQEIPEYLKLAEIVVFPSTAESSSIACAEAMAMGKKVVASRVGGLIELLGENNERGTLVRLIDWEGSNYDAPISLPIDRYQVLAKAVVEALTGQNEDKAVKACEYAKDNLRWEIISKKTEGLYKKLLCL